MYMKSHIPLLLLIIVLLSACGQNNEQQRMLEEENEELKAELRRAEAGIATLQEVGVLLDSIDAARKSIQLELEAGTSYDDYIKRMKELQDYVANTEEKIAGLEQSFSQAAQQNKAYLATISRLRGKLSEQEREIQALSQTVERYKNKNQELLSLVELQEAEIDDKSETIERKTEELNLLENRILEIMKQAEMTEADAYFARAEAIEEAANRTKLAPRKKKETYQEAIDLYKRAFAMGREDARQKIDELEEKI